MVLRGHGVPEAILHKRYGRMSLRAERSNLKDACLFEMPLQCR